jgi:hypothetical protein
MKKNREPQTSSERERCPDKVHYYQSKGNKLVVELLLDALNQLNIIHRSIDPSSHRNKTEKNGTFDY